MKKMRLAFALFLALLMIGALSPVYAQTTVGGISVVDISNPSSLPTMVSDTGVGWGNYSTQMGSVDCPTADRLIQVPAVVGDQEGGLVDLDVSVAPGNGSMYTTIYPTVGLSTQESEQQAVVEAFANLSVKPEDCDVAFSFQSDGTSGSVDGPSAGVAMTVALRAALTGKALRSDVIITGAILPGGKVGPVGGLIDKAQAASRSGKRIFLTSHQEIYESIVMAGMARQYNFTAIQVHTMPEAFAIATSAPGTAYASNFTLENKVVPSNLSARAQNDGDARFAAVANSINDDLARKVAAGATGPLAPYQAYFQKEIEQNRMLAQEGYAYTSANNAFLSEVDADFLSTPSRALDVGSHIKDVQNCLRTLRPAQPTDLNYEWVAGANARAAWARQKMQDIANRTTPYDSSEEKYLTVRELYYAQSWCEAAGYMTTEAELIGGAPADGKALQAQARADLQHAYAAFGSDGPVDADAAWHLTIANASLSRGDYLAAIYDSAYGAGAQTATLEEANQTNATLTRTISNLESQPMATLWGRTYQSQGVFTQLQSETDGTGGLGGHLVLRLAAAEEDALGRAGRTLSGAPGVSVQIGLASGGAAEGQRVLDLVLLLVILAGAGALLVSIGRQMRAVRKR